ncbi:MAG: hypothetical protein SV186_03310 [Candidatus Nanohaloarchaea archaeon]|nr:hypothetical protein [Candidatus Nanohaloarchaea archaeon]
MDEDNGDRSLAEEILERAAISHDAGSDDQQESERRVRRNRTEHELEQHLDKDSSTALWTIFSLHDTASVTAQQLPDGIDLILQEQSGRTSHYPLTDPTGFQREERAFIHGRAEQLHELFEARPELFPTPDNTAETRVARDTRPGDTDRIRLQTQLEANLDADARAAVWTVLDIAPHLDSVTVKEVGNTLALIGRQEDRQKSYILLAADSTGFDSEERHYISEHIDDIVALYHEDRELYLQDSRI